MPGSDAAIGYCAVMQRLALFDLDNTLVQRDRAFAAWADEFVAEHGLDRRVARGDLTPGPSQNRT